jgi:hypothetical protein
MEDTFDFGLLRGGINFFGVYDGHAGLRAVNVCCLKPMSVLSACSPPAPVYVCVCTNVHVWPSRAISLSLSICMYACMRVSMYVCIQVHS